MHTVTHFEANKVGEYILLDMKVTDGDAVLPGAKAVALDADLKVEADILAAEIIDAYAAKAANVVPMPIPVDVSDITVEIKTLEAAMAVKQAAEDAKKVIESPVEEAVIE